MQEGRILHLCLKQLLLHCIDLLPQLFLLELPAPNFHTAIKGATMLLSLDIRSLRSLLPPLLLFGHQGFLQVLELASIMLLECRDFLLLRCLPLLYARYLASNKQA